MQTTTATQTIAGARPTCWIKRALARSWASFLGTGQPQWHQDTGTVKHRQAPQVHGVPHAPAHAFSMLVESDILRGSRSVLP